MFFIESVSEIINALASLFTSKNLLNTLVFFTSFFTSASMWRFLSEFFFDKVCAKASFLTFLLIFLILYTAPLGPWATPPPTNKGAFLLACLAPPPPFCGTIFL